MKINLPENISEITLGQFLKYQELETRGLDAFNFNRRKLSLFTGIRFKDTPYIKSNDYDRILNQIDKALSTDVEFHDRFTIHNIEFGFIPDLDKITMAEYADLSSYGTNTEDLHRLMAVLFRPIVNREGNSYSIMGYNGTEEYSNMMLDMPLNCVNGALVFFYNLANELQKATQRYLTEELQREIQPPTISRISVGIQRLRNWLTTTSLR
jgi:hypothetical protein